jgi:DNA-binding transcriptional regulator YiaG
MYQLDVKAVIRRFGGRTELWRRLTAMNHSISVKTIEKWTERSSIPSSQLLVLMALAKKEGKPLVIADYVISPQTDNEHRPS